MSEILTLRGAEPRAILETAVTERIPAVMSYLSRGKWHIAKVIPAEIGATRLAVELAPRRKPHPINIRCEQPVGLSLKHRSGKVVFESAVMGLEPSQDPMGRGRIVLKLPDHAELVERRSYFRVDVPADMNVKVVLWSHRQEQANARSQQNSAYIAGHLVDISAGGAQIAITNADKSVARRGQFVGVRFTPMPFEQPLMFDCQIRNVLPTADGQKACLGVQIVGLESSSQGRRTLERLCDIVEKYYKMNQNLQSSKDQNLSCASAEGD